MFVFKIDEKTELRLLEERHAEQLFALIAGDRKRHPELEESFSLEDAKTKIRKDLMLFAENKGLGVGIWHDGDLAGSVRYHEIDWPNRMTELGYWLGGRFEGKGLIVRTCGAMINHAFNCLGLNRIVISCAAQNGKSRAIPEKLGFREEGILRESEWLRDRFADMVIYGLLASEWRGQNASGKV